MFGSGPSNPRWNELGRFVDEQGYLMVRVGEGHPLACKRAYAYEHVVVWCAAGNEPPGPDETIDHIDQDKTNNRLDNLRVLTRVEHARHHAAQRTRVRGRFAKSGMNALAEALLADKRVER